MDPEVLLQQLGELGKQLDTATSELTRLDVVATGASVHHAGLKKDLEKATAQAFLTCEGPMEVRKMQATLSTADLREDLQEAYAAAKTAESQVRNQQEVIRALNRRIDIGRSLVSHQKTQMEMDGLPGPRWHS
jgi:hypothetical protein